MRSKYVLFSGTLSLLVMTASLAFAGSDDREPAPRFHAKTLEGEQFNNESTKGKVVLFQFWTTWCPYCKGEESLVNDITKEFADKGLIVLAVDVAESKKKVLSIRSVERAGRERYAGCWKTLGWNPKTRSRFFCRPLLLDHFPFRFTAYELAEEVFRRPGLSLGG